MPESRLILEASDESATAAVGTALAATAPSAGAVVTLAGELGAGKTTLARSLLRALGVTGTVRSPTYTLLEPYRVAGRELLHLDLYRLGGADELAALGYRELASGDALLLVEWPERAAGALGPVDLALRLEYWGAGRRLLLEAGSALGADWLARLASRLPQPAGRGDPGQSES
jgi:tRNA threonylcarbamoyladenosine biosynthesis protein TsaE